MTTTGTVASVPMAMISPHLMSKDVMNSAMPTGMVFELPSVMRMLANRNSFQDSTNTKTPTEKVPGKAKGRKIRRKALKKDAPSTQAASSISRGIFSKKERNIQSANGNVNTQWQMTNPAMVSTSPSALMMT